MKKVTRFSSVRTLADLKDTRNICEIQDAIKRESGEEHEEIMNNNRLAKIVKMKNQALPDLLKRTLNVNVTEQVHWR